MRGRAHENERDTHKRMRKRHTERQIKQRWTDIINVREKERESEKRERERNREIEREKSRDRERKRERENKQILADASKT
jgi:hypothetical protein